MTKVELFEHIRRLHFLEKKSIRHISRIYKIHRRMVRQAIISAVPPVRKKANFSAVVLTPAIKDAIDQFLIEDKKAPKKQRHTGQRIFERLVENYDYQGALPTIKKYLGSRKRQLGLSKEVFIPQMHLPGEEAEVDWYEAWVEFPHGKEKIQIFQMRACFSGREFHRAYPNQTQQAFLEAHVEAFNYFGGVFHRIRYDNLTAAVKKVLTGRKRLETERFTILRSHYVFESFFCKPGKEGAHEKGGVEGGVGRFRRAHLVPVPKFKDYTELNSFLIFSCTKDDNRIIRGHSGSIFENWNAEISKLLPLPSKVFESHSIRTPIVNHKGCVMVDTNQYSVPIKYVNSKVEARLLAQNIDFWYQGKLIATHKRLYGQYQLSLKLDHYLELLHHKPGALKGSIALAQARQQGSWPKSYDCLWQELINRLGQSSGTQEMLKVLFLHRSHPCEKVHQAVEQALELGGVQIGILELIISREWKKLDPLHLNETLKKYDREATSLNCYDDLLRGNYYG